MADIESRKQQQRREIVKTQTKSMRLERTTVQMQPKLKNGRTERNRRKLVIV